ncbi:RidA family protein [Actinophytocola glycyrrhizae]|uniref:RidA family protein n=1 Tax=Actinophytocola glycyrrhizae TaxID=2044873 RepID=A0ABV9SGA5_9PSEU
MDAGEVAPERHHRLGTGRGATFAAVVDIRTYLTDMSRLREYGEVRAAYLDGALPTSTTVEVSRLFRPGALPEADVTAVVPGTA